MIEISKTVLLRMIVALLAGLLLNLAILFTVPPANTLGVVIKDVASVIIMVIIYLKMRGNGKN